MSCLGIHDVGFLCSVSHPVSIEGKLLTIIRLPLRLLFTLFLVLCTPPVDSTWDIITLGTLYLYRKLQILF